MIKYEGIIVRDKFHFLVFSNGENNRVEIVIDKPTAFRVMANLNKIAISHEKHVEVMNDEPSE